MTDTTARAERQSVLRDVAEFHRAFGHPVKVIPQVIVRADLEELRISLLREEFEEYLAAVEANDIVEIADALAGMQYIINGTALVYGIDLDAVHAEVHRSNMSKLGPNGQVIRRADGKVLKPETYQPPMVAAVLDEQDGFHLRPTERDEVGA
jgi:predicted HAD superfamily Cof-like phosphohydrolase